MIYSKEKLWVCAGNVWKNTLRTHWKLIGCHLDHRGPKFHPHGLRTGKRQRLMTGSYPLTSSNWLVGALQAPTECWRLSRFFAFSSGVWRACSVFDRKLMQLLFHRSRFVQVVWSRARYRLFEVFTSDFLLWQQCLPALTFIILLFFNISSH